MLYTRYLCGVETLRNTVDADTGKTGWDLKYEKTVATKNQIEPESRERVA